MQGKSEFIGSEVYCSINTDADLTSPRPCFYFNSVEEPHTHTTECRLDSHSEGDPPCEIRKMQTRG